MLLRTEMPQRHWIKRFALPSIYVTNPTNFRRQSISNLISNIVAVILFRLAAINCSKETPSYNFEINSQKPLYNLYDELSYIFMNDDIHEHMCTCLFHFDKH